MKPYTIGQIIYVVSSDNVLPYQVVEENVKSTLAGTQVSYVVRCGPNNDHIELSKVNGEIFTSIADVQQSMLLKVTAFVNKHIDQAIKKEQLWYSEEKSQPREKVDDVVQETMILPDGRVAKVNIKMPT